MIEYILSIIVLSVLALVIIFWPIKFTALKSQALLLALLSLFALLGLNFARNQTQQALEEYAQDKAYEQLVRDFLSGQQANIENANELDALSFLRSLQRHLQRNIRDSHAWIMLGNALQGVDNNRHSLMAYQRAYRVNREDEATILAYVNTRLSTLGEQSQADNESIELLNAVLEKNPQQENALMLLGVAAYQGKEFELAAEAWSKLLNLFQQRSVAQNQEVPDKVISALQSSIDKAKTKADNQNQEITTEASNFNMVINISINQSAEKDLETKHDNNAVLFVYARKPEQKGMPLAAIKYPLAKSVAFPFSLTLSNQNSLAGIDLSQFDSIELSARISFSGQAIPQSGDWQSDTLLVTEEAFGKPQNLEIHRLLDGKP